MATKYLLLLLPTLIYARIHVDIVASKDDGHRKVEISGANMDIISDTERMSFGLNDEGLKQAVQAHFGRRPSNAYVRSPTPWGDLYQSYNWAQVTRTLTPQKAKILSITSQPTIVQTSILYNNSTRDAEFKARVTQEVQNTVASTWEHENVLTVGQDIEYGVEIEMASVSGKTSFQYTNKWGESTTKSEAVTVGSEAGVTISLAPKQSVTAELYVMKGTMKIQVEYEATLSGIVAVNYDDTYRGHHFWSLDVNAVMNAGGLKKSVRSTETITIGYFADAKVVIKDNNDKTVLFSIPMAMH